MLTDLTIRQARVTGKPYTLSDFDGLYLHVSAIGTKAWHFRFTHRGTRERISFGTYPAISVKDARTLRDEARALLAKGLNPHFERQRQCEETVTASEHTFMVVHEQWLDYRLLSLEEGRQTSLSQIARVPRKDVFPALRELRA